MNIARIKTKLTLYTTVWQVNKQDVQ